MTKFYVGLAEGYLIGDSGEPFDITINVRLATAFDKWIDADKAAKSAIKIFVKSGRLLEESQYYAILKGTTN